MKVLTSALLCSPFSGADALPNGLDVTFEVIEIKRLTGSYNTMVGNNEGSMVRRAALTVLSGGGGFSLSSDIELGSHDLCI